MSADLPDIASIGFPLAYKMRDSIPGIRIDEDAATAVRVYGRALKGMQKEAIVHHRTDSDVRLWRLVCDEGPYLNGTDLAPFPLAFFCAGMQFSLMAELVRLAARESISLKSMHLIQDNFYTMDGSAIKGTMIGGALPVEVQLEIESNAPLVTITRLLKQAEQASAAHALMRDVLSNTFALTYNGRSLPVTEVKASPAPILDALDAVFDAAHPDNSPLLDNIIGKRTSAEKITGVEGGAGSSLQSEQKRTLHIHGEARLLDTDPAQFATTIQLLKPIGSTFSFHCDSAGELAPPPLAILAAGIAFCYMTQLGRYAHITKQNYRSYRIIQDVVFRKRGQTVAADALDTHVFYEADESDTVAQKTISMGERTCFLHAAMRGSYPTQIAVRLNEESPVFV